MEDNCEPGPTVYSLYPTRLEVLSGKDKSNQVLRRQHFLLSNFKIRVRVRTHNLPTHDIPMLNQLSHRSAVHVALNFAIVLKIVSQKPWKQSR